MTCTYSIFVFHPDGAFCAVCGDGWLKGDMEEYKNSYYCDKCYKAILEEEKKLKIRKKLFGH